MISKNASRILFATSIATLIVLFSGMNNVSAEVSNNYSEEYMATFGATYNPDMIDYLNQVINSGDEMIQEKVIDEKTYTVSKSITVKDKNIYNVLNIVTIDGEEQLQDVFQIIRYSKNTIELVNESQGTSEIFTNQTPWGFSGVGYSSYSGAAIVLSDRERGSANTVNLSDNFNSCRGFNNAEFESDVNRRTIDVSWDGSQMYLHSCFFPHFWDRTVIKVGNQEYQVEAADIEKTRHYIHNHIFKNTVGSYGIFDTKATFYYGSW